VAPAKNKSPRGRNPRRGIEERKESLGPTPYSLPGKKLRKSFVFHREKTAMTPPRGEKRKGGNSSGSRRQGRREGEEKGERGSIASKETALILDKRKKRKGGVTI